MTAIEEFLVDPSEPTALSAGAISDFVYRYSGTDGLACTLGTEQIRLNAWSSMNDPRERSPHRRHPRECPTQAAARRGTNKRKPELDVLRVFERPGERLLTKTESALGAELPRPGRPPWLR